MWVDKVSQAPVKEEWVDLLLYAKRNGITVADIRHYLQEYRIHKVTVCMEENQ